MDQATLKSLLHYDQDTGAFNWIGGLAGIRAGAKAGHLMADGYRAIHRHGRRHQEHRLAWIYVHGSIPAGMHVDHINGDKQDNRIANLRPCTRSQNLQNQRRPQRHNKTGYLGVHLKRNKYQAQIFVDGRVKRLGLFDTPEEASAAYLAAKRRLHEFCTI